MPDPPPEVLCAVPAPPSPARVRASERAPLRVGLVQERWRSDPDAHREALATGIHLAAAEGATLVCLQELTLSPYFAITPAGPGAAGAVPEELQSGPTITFARTVAADAGVYVHASLYERADGDDGLGYNTAVVVAPDGRLVSRTRKLHIPITAGYYENRYFRPGPADPDAFPVISLPIADDPAHPALLGCPTCWDQWFPELARAYSLAGAEVLIYPTAIGSEPDHPDFDTQPLWEQVIVANGVANGTFMVAINRIGTEPPLTFYGSSFISDPYGRVLVRAPRNRAAVLVADLDLDQRRDWLELFPFLTTRRPDAYAPLTRS
jgi:N-carbamoylputrescine amidase